MGRVRWAELEEQGLAGGLDVMAAASAEPLADARRTLEQRRDAGLNGTMQFTYRNPARSTDPERTLPGVRTLIAGATSYHRDPPPEPEGRGPVARVARYVWADDRDRLLAGLQAVCDALVDAGSRACVVSDQNHLVDRAVAERAGLGWFGKNANLLLPGRGSWYLLGSVLTDAVVDDAPEPRPVADACGTCERCRPACPTGAIVTPGTVDARRCLSWSLQMTGSFPRDQRVALGDRLYGCDECQEVCPPNRLEVRRAGPGGSGTPVALGRPDRAWVPVLEVLAATDDELLAAHGRWYIADRDPRYLRRNALVVLGNIGDPADPRVRAALAEALADRDPLLRAHAVWSARRLGCDDLLVDLERDPDPDVQAELDLPVVARTPA
ncbi:MAG: tRNA epoxyqueuosine(34) reductase QueG [Ilumatobacteraceae bacterium]|nr:tRNA epoxyqueuosine(34) reductase QueG [Ilumatobacteraceae bacterium]